MKTLKLPTFLAGIAILAFTAGSSNGVTVPASSSSATPVSEGETTAQKSAEVVELPNGAGDVLKLTRAKVNEDVTMAFVQNSGRHYSLTASQIVYLHDQGVSDRVLTAMLTQPQRTPQAVPRQAQPPTAAPEPNSQY